jgi:hypothetical protein
MVIAFIKSYASYSNFKRDSAMSACFWCFNFYFDKIQHAQTCITYQCGEFHKSTSCKECWTDKFQIIASQNFIFVNYWGSKTQLARLEISLDGAEI